MSCQLTPSVRALETQISELEAEAARLLRALDAAKEAESEARRREQKKATDSEKEVASLVSCPIKTETQLIISPPRSRASNLASNSMPTTMRSSVSWKS